MPHELVDPARRRLLLKAHAGTQVELLDSLDRLPPAALSLFVDDLDHPTGFLAIAWGEGPLGLSNEAALVASRITSLDDLLEGLPRGRGSTRLTCPFFAAPAVSARFKCELLGPVGRYHLEGEMRDSHPAAEQACPLRPEDLEIVSFAFPRTVPDAPHRALTLRNELVAVAVTTHLAGGVARFGVHVGEEHRGHGFGGGVTHALLTELRARGLTPTTELALDNEPGVRLLESAGLALCDTRLAFDLAGQRPV